MEQSGLSVKDLARLIGKSNCVYEIRSLAAPAQGAAPALAVPGA